MPRLNFFDLLRESDLDFVQRTGWVYRIDAPIHVPDPCVIVHPPFDGHFVS